MDADNITQHQPESFDFDLPEITLTSEDIEAILSATASVIPLSYEEEVLEEAQVQTPLTASVSGSLDDEDNAAPTIHKQFQRMRNCVNQRAHRDRVRKRAKTYSLLVSWLKEKHSNIVLEYETEHKVTLLPS